jgi:T4 RnlA family RNA ligase
MKYFLKTKLECDEICDRNDAFFKIDREIAGFKVAIYDYRLASITDFIKDEGQELRGLTFILNPKTNEWERHLLLQKFHNLNEAKFNDEYTWMYEDLKDIKIEKVQNKEDGSIISFVLFPDGGIRAKSKTSFTSEQAQEAQKYYDSNPIFQEELTCLLKKGLIPIFEIVGSWNQIVLEYKETELILLQIRDNVTGHYLHTEELKWYSTVMNIRTAKQYPKEYNSFEKLLELRETETNIEGWVITLVSGQMIKLKTLWYLSLHRLVSPTRFQKNHLIEIIINGEFDDVIAQLNEGTKKEQFIEIEDKVSKIFNNLVHEFIILRGSYYNIYNENRKEFALKNSKHPLFKYVMKTINTSMRDVDSTAKKCVSEYIRKSTKNLKDAKKFIENL